MCGVRSLVDWSIECFRPVMFIENCNGGLQKPCPAVP